MSTSPPCLPDLPSITARPARTVKRLQERDGKARRAGIACKQAAPISYSFFEDFHRIIAAARTSKHHINRPRELVSLVASRGTVGRLFAKQDTVLS